MSLVNFLERENLKAVDLAAKANVPKSSISTHLKYEETNGVQGRRLGLELSLRIIQAFPELTLEDLRPDWAERLEASQG